MAERSTGIGQYWDVIRYKVRADLKSDKLKTYAGILWWILDPILFMLVFYVVFSVLRQAADDFVQFLLIGLVIWRWWAAGVSNGANSVVQAKGLIKQVYLPKQIFPIVSLLTDTFKFAIVFMLLLLFLWYSGMPANEHYVWLPFLLICQFLFIMGVEFAISAIVPFVPDLQLAISYVIRLMFFTSGIFFKVESIPEEYHVWFYANPMANFIEAFRDVLMYGQAPDVERFGIIAVSSLTALMFGWFLLGKFNRVYPKVIH
jgi:lipopolysaccharide transport system permease protein